ncbi:MAG: PDZ domain-containing protein, partial [Bacteroidota bacterium]
MKRLFTFVLFLTFSTTSFLQAQHHNNSPQAFLGVYSNPVSNKKAAALKLDEPNGVLVTSVIDNTPAAENGLRPFDYIYQIGDYKLKPHQSLTYVMRNFQPDDEATVYFIRDTKMLSQNVSFGRKSDAVYTERTAEEDPFLGIEQNHDEVPDDVVGVPVNIVNNSSAEKMGLQDGDIVTAINGYPIYDWHDSGAAIDMMEVGDEMEVTYYRNNQYKTAAA